MSASGTPAARNWSASNFATRGTSPRLWTLGISIACLKTSRAFVCHSAGNFVGSVRGSVAATVALETAATRIATKPRFIRELLFSCDVLQHQLPMHDVIVQGLNGQALVASVSAIVGRNLDPSAIDAIDRDSGNAERP